MQDSYVSELFALDRYLQPFDSLQLFSKMTSYSEEDMRKQERPNWPCFEPPKLTGIFKCQSFRGPETPKTSTNLNQTLLSQKM